MKLVIKNLSFKKLNNSKQLESKVVKITKTRKGML